jgi:hypothetical protein
VIHGAETVPEVVRSVGTFVATLQRVVVHEQLNAAEVGATLLARLERTNLRIAARNARLEAGVAVAEAIFDE